jgi:hypothetical protein
MLRVCVRRLACPPSSTRAPCYFVVCGVPGFPRYFINCKIFRNKLLNIKYVFWFSLQILCETFLILRRNERDMINSIQHIGRNVQYRRCSCQILIKLEFSRQNFEKYSSVKFNENPSNGSRVVPCGQTDGRTETDRHDQDRSPFHNFANAPTNGLLFN